MTHEQLPPNERIAVDVWAKTPEVERVALTGELEQVKARLAKQEEQLRRNSQKSSQPPSQDKSEQKQASIIDQARTARQTKRALGPSAPVGIARSSR